MRTMFCLLVGAVCGTHTCTGGRAEAPSQRARVYILDLGWMECDANWIVAMSVVGTMGDPHPTARWIKIPVYAVLIDHPEGKMLYDTGCPPSMANDTKSPFPYYHDENQTLVRQLALARTRPEEIKTLILSHLHFDHAGSVGLFKRAEICLHKRELDVAQAGGGGLPADLKSWVARCRPVEGDREIARGVRLLALPGHTAGLLGLMVELKNDGTLIFPSDAVYSRGNYGSPARLSGIVYDSLSYFSSIEKVRSLVQKHGARLMFPHDMDFFRTLTTTPRCYD